MKLLITRPAEDAEKLVAQLSDLSVACHRAPLMTITPNSAPLPDPATLGGLAFTSVNGLRALVGRAKHLEDWQRLPAYCVGPQSAAAAEQAGFHQCHQAAGDVETLAQLIADLHAPQAAPVAHFAGAHLAGNLQALLEAQHIAVEKCVLYEAVAATQFDRATEAALMARTLDGVVLYSQRSARVFLSLFQPLGAPPLRAYCLAPAIAEIMQAEGFESRCAATPDAAGMLALIAEDL
jgi:uroporphyrinogen-III synthase